MVAAAARVDDLERGELPPICAKTGVACDELVKDTLRVIPRWVPPLAVLLIVPYFVARAYTGRRVEAKLPIASERRERIRKLVRVSWFALVAAAAGFSSLFFGAGPVGLAAFAAGLLGYLVIVYVGDQMWVGARPSRRADVVILTRVHPEFARVLAEQYTGGTALPADY